MQDNHSIKTVEIQFANAQLLPEIVKLLEEGVDLGGNQLVGEYWQKSATDITCFIASSRFRTRK